MKNDFNRYSCILLDYLDSNSLVSRLHEFKMKKKKKDNADIELADSSHTGAKPPL